MRRKGAKNRKKVVVRLSGHQLEKKNVKKSGKKKPNKRHHVHYQCQCHTHPRPRIQASKGFHDNCCKYKIRPRPMRTNQCNLATQCPSRTIPLAASVPLLRHPVQRKVVRLPETVVMDMRNTEDARRLAVSYKNTLIRTILPVRDFENGGSLEELGQIDLRPRHAYRTGRKIPLPSDMDLCEDFYE
ncbi:uncharacterized protein LOC108022363 [Drosophila biarmipes]|uniref:uncharacterized protein LOC108022363 n=1 Tax=Drosophila biarmipes TaxID=125945 RepID=UPI0007E65D30|nr:uncharacterized protein LOC108022363 [Drosophila biarmipes]